VIDKALKVFDKVVAVRFPTFTVPDDIALPSMASTLRAGPCRIRQGDTLWWVRPIGEGIEVEVWPMHIEGGFPLTGTPRSVAIQMAEYCFPPRRTVRRTRAERVRALARGFRSRHFA